MRRTLIACGLGALLLTLSACASPLSRLPSERDIPQLAVLVDRVEATDNHTYLVPTQIEDEAPVRIAVHETGEPSDNRIVVLIHGVFTDSATWRYVHGALLPDNEVWLVDLPGCGDSDIPSPDDLPAFGYSPDQLAQRVLQALDERLAQRDDNPTLAIVGHSLGGQVAIQMTTDPRLADLHATTIARIDRVALLSPADVDIAEPDPLFLELITLSGWKVRVGAALGVLQRKVATGTRDGAGNPDFAVRENAEARISILRDKARRQALQAMLRDSVPTIDYDDLDRDAIKREVADYARMTIPCMILWGALDDTLPVDMGYKLATELPTAELVLFDESKHGVHHDEPERCATLLTDFFNTGYAARDLSPGLRLAVTKPRPTDTGQVMTPVLLGN